MSSTSLSYPDTCTHHPLPSSYFTDPCSTHKHAHYAAHEAAGVQEASDSTDSLTVYECDHPRSQVKPARRRCYSMYLDTEALQFTVTVFMYNLPQREIPLSCIIKWNNPSFELIFTVQIHSADCESPHDDSRHEYSAVITQIGSIQKHNRVSSIWFFIEEFWTSIV